MLIGITGRSGCGKGTVASILEKHFGAHILSTSKVLRTILTAQGVPCTRENLQNLALEMHERQGPLVLMHMLMQQVTDDRIYVIDAIRTVPQNRWLAAQKNAMLFGVHSHFCLRLERLQQRARDAGDAALCVADLQKQDRHPIESDMHTLLTASTWLFMNDGTLAELEKEVVLRCTALCKTRADEMNAA